MINMVTQAEREEINRRLDAAGYREYEDRQPEYRVILDEPHHIYFSGTYEECKHYIRHAGSKYPLDILSLKTGRLVSYVL